MVLKQNEGQYEKDKQELENDMEQIADYYCNPSFGFKDGRLNLVEKDLILNSKLSQINGIVHQYFKDNSNLSMQSQIIKTKDISEYPSKRRAQRCGLSPERLDESHPDLYKLQYAK